MRDKTKERIQKAEDALGDWWNEYMDAVDGCACESNFVAGRKDIYQGDVAHMVNDILGRIALLKDTEDYKKPEVQ